MSAGNKLYRKIKNIGSTYGKDVIFMDEQKQELHKIIDKITNPKLVNYILELIKTFRDRGEV